MDKRTFNPCDECRYGIDRRDGSGSDAMCKICEFRKLLNRRHNPKQEALTLEQLREMAKKPLKHWVWIENFKSPENSGYMRTHSDWSEGEYFCCGWPGVSYSFEYTDYGKTWLAYTTRPETEGD